MDNAMRELASHWISPSPYDVELTRFATGHKSPVDWPEFIAECERNQRDYAANDSDRDELQSLIAYARERMQQ